MGTNLIGIQRLGPAGAEFTQPSQAELGELRERFAQDHCVHLPDFLSGAVRDEILEGVGQARFFERRHGQIGTEGCMEANATLACLVLIANDQRLFHVVRQITGCGQVGCFDGRVYRLSQSAGHGDSWHSDFADHRMVAMSVNLSSAPYRGGELRIRDADGTRPVYTAPDAAPGDALVFRLAEHLRHRVMPVDGPVPRTAFAGWFKAQPSFGSVLKGASWSA